MSELLSRGGRRRGGGSDLLEEYVFRRDKITTPHQDVRRWRTSGSFFFIGSGLLDQQKINSTIDRNVQKVCEQNLD